VRWRVDNELMSKSYSRSILHVEACDANKPRETKQTMLVLHVGCNQSFATNALNHLMDQLEERIL